MKTSAKLLVGLGVLILASIGYYFAFHFQNESKRKEEEHVSHKDKIVNQHQLALLPVTESPLYLIGVGNGVRVADLGVEEPPIIEELISIGIKIDKSNAIGRSVPFGHFVLNDSFSPIGFSFVSVGQYEWIAWNIVGFTPTGGPPFDGFGRYAWGDFHWDSYPYPDPKLSGRDLKISDLTPFDTVEGLEYIHFADVGFGAGIWASLRKLSSRGHLKGVSVFFTNELLEQRDAEVIPEITGVAAHIRSIEELSEIASAFPNLSFLSIGLSRELFVELVEKKTLANNFQHLLTLRLHGIESHSAKEQLAISASGSVEWDERRILDRFASARWISRSIDFLDINGNLLSADEMERYGSLARNVRRRPGKTHVECVYGRFGFVDKNTRPFDYVKDLERLESVWRNTNTPNKTSHSNRH